MKKKGIQIILSFIFFIIGIITKTDYAMISLLCFIVSYLLVGFEIIIKAIKNIFKVQIFDENFLMAIATIGAFAIHDYAEAVAVLLFYQVGELFQDYAVGKSRKSIKELMDIKPDYANIMKDGELIKVEPEDIKINDIIIVKAGEKIPLDGIVIKGSSMLDTRALTGESVPREVSINSEVLSGCINTNGLLEIKVTKGFGESTVSKILDLVENASNKKSKSEKFISKFAAVYTPIVVLLALLLAFIPPLLLNGDWNVWIYRALSFLIVSCPCALVISIPLSFFGGIGGASRNGILVKGGNYLEVLAKTEIVVFDKTGTLTKGVFEVQEINAVNISKEELIEITAYAEYHSNHPISLSLQRAYNKKINGNLIKEVEEISGYGVSALINGKRIHVGNDKLMNYIHVTPRKSNLPGTILHVALDLQYIGYILIADEVKEDSKRTVKDLKELGIKQTIMLTGDNKIISNHIAEELNVDKVYSELLPADKVEKVEGLLVEKSNKGKLIFVGDGINDAPVLTISDIGIAMGGVGSDAAIEAADIVIMTDQPSKVVSAIKIAKKTLKVARQNIVIALSIKVLVLLLSALGYASMWHAVFADVGVSVIAICNSLRCLSTKKI